MSYEHESSYIVSDKKLDPTLKWKKSQIPLFEKGVSIWDVRQGATGNCWLLSCLAGIAYTDPKSIKKLFKVSGDYITVPIHYEKYKLKKDAYIRNFNYYTVSNTLAETSRDNNYNFDSWVNIYEKAAIKAAGLWKLQGQFWPQDRKGYKLLNSGNNYTPEVLTGFGEKKVSYDDHIRQTGRLDPSEYEQFLESGGTIQLTYDSHVYTMMDYNLNTGTALLYNPWGKIEDSKLDLKLQADFNFEKAIGYSIGVKGNDDEIIGDKGDSFHRGFAGNDTLVGNGGFDLLSGGQGEDLFDARGYDIEGEDDYCFIEDFWSVKDKIMLYKNENYISKLEYSNRNRQNTFNIYTRSGDLIAKVAGSEKDLLRLDLKSDVFLYSGKKKKDKNSNAHSSNNNQFHYANDNESEYYLYNNVTEEIIRLCNYSDIERVEALREDGFYILSPENYGNLYDYPAVYAPPGMVWDQSEENRTNGDWTMYSDSNPHEGVQPAPQYLTTPELQSEPLSEYNEYEPLIVKNKIIGTMKDNNLAGTKSIDYLYGKKGDDTLTGMKGNDVLKGGDGRDVLIGSKGKDYLDGSTGFDVLIGGQGADVFQISKGTDLVEDFSINQSDRIALDKEGQYTIIDHPDGVLIMASPKKRLLLGGVDYDDVIAVGDDLFVQPV